MSLWSLPGVQRLHPSTSWRSTERSLTKSAGDGVSKEGPISRSACSAARVFVGWDVGRMLTVADRPGWCVAAARRRRIR